MKALLRVSSPFVGSDGACVHDAVIFIESKEETEAVLCKSLVK